MSDNEGDVTEIPPAENGDLAMSQTSDHESKDQNTEVEELNDEGVGGTMGAQDTFEPEESEAPASPSSPSE